MRALCIVHPLLQPPPQALLPRLRPASPTFAYGRLTCQQKHRVMSLPRSLIHQPQHTINLAYDCPDRVDQLSVCVGVVKDGLDMRLCVRPCVDSEKPQSWRAPYSFTKRVFNSHPEVRTFTE